MSQEPSIREQYIQDSNLMLRYALNKGIAVPSSIVKTLESGDQPLDASLTQFERGVALARFCQQSLATAEQKIKILSTEDGEESLDEFDPEGE